MDIKNLLEKAKAFLQTKRGQNIIILIGVIGILLIVLSSVFKPSDRSAVYDAAAGSGADYAKQLEAELKTLVGKIEGAGKCDVMVTLENGGQNVYATEAQSNSNRAEEGGTSQTRISESDDSRETVILVDGENGKSGLLVTAYEPIVRGVVVVCEGGSDETVCARIREALRTALDITEKRVCIIKMGGT